MAKTITLKYTPTVDDHVKGTQTFILHIARFRVIILIFMLTFIAGIVLYIASEAYAVAAVVLMGLLPIMAMGIFVFTPMMLKRRIRQDRRVLAERVWELTDEDFSIKNQYAEVTFDWAGFNLVKETRGQYVFIASTFVFVPKRAFTSKKQETDFREMVKRRVKKVEFIGE